LKIAALERFRDPSRRYAAGRIREPGDEVVVWDIAGLHNQPPVLLRELPGALGNWLGLEAPSRTRRRLLRACLGTRGARLGALVYAPELWRRVRDREVDRIACFSAKDFNLARLLAKETGVRPDELIARGTQYFGEFAFELLAVVPYAYWLHRNGRLDFTISTQDTRALYYFSQNHEERHVPRRYVPITEYPSGEGGKWRYDQHAFSSSLDDTRWLPPPYREAYADDRLRFAKETCIVCNKASDESYLHHGFSVNAMSPELAVEVVGRLRDRYQVVYVRPRGSDIVNDHQEIRELGDIEAVERAYPDVLTIQSLHGEHPGLTFNELQLRLFAGCERFVSVLGGGSYLASYFGGTNVIYARRGWELRCGAYERWFDRFSGARVVTASTPRDLLAAAERELLA
jgi:hypothetical protein